VKADSKSIQHRKVEPPDHGGKTSLDLLPLVIFYSIYRVLKVGDYMYKKGSMRWKHVSNNVTIFTQNDSVHALKLHL
jgi:hypothetical protein